MTILQENNNA